MNSNLSAEEIAPFHLSLHVSLLLPSRITHNVCTPTEELREEKAKEIDRRKETDGGKATEGLRRRSQTGRDAWVRVQITPTVPPKVCLRLFGSITYFLPFFHTHQKLGKISMSSKSLGFRRVSLDWPAKQKLLPAHKRGDATLWAKSSPKTSLTKITLKQNHKRVLSQCTVIYRLEENQTAYRLKSSCDISQRFRQIY